MDTANKSALAVIILVFMLGWTTGLFTGGAVGIWLQRSSLEESLIDSDLAHYVADPKTGETKLVVDEKFKFLLDETQK